ncbi:MAG: preprotein translocase subunit SecA, preprotein translocase subunit SecA [Candidatus Parcubacteria bacterium]|jgi:preprotein translocase subunit SecA
MFKFITKYFDYNEKEIGRLKKRIQEINDLEDKARALKNEDFKHETHTLKTAIEAGEKTTDDVLPWAFALAREATRRVLGQRHYDVQLIAALALHEKKVVEQKTGEGKTQTAIAALYLNALTGKGVHLVTVNDYLARIGTGWMGPVFHFLGLSTSAIISDKSYIFDPDFTDSEVIDWRMSHLRTISRKEAYLADVTYGINSEFGFDYLRDNMASNVADLRQRGFYYAIIDEADSVLIDEARTPHIISAPFEQDTSKYYKYAQMVKQLRPEIDFIIDEKLRTANLTEEGIKHIESMLGVANVYEKDFDTLFHIEAALKAEALFKNDKEYIVKDGEVIIVDEFTGRLLQGRRFSEGLHQAIEAKENVAIQKESKTLATVSLQNYFRMYEKLAGMTGTASTEAEEFNKIYKVDVVTIPTHRPMVRKDEADMIYKTEKAKFNAVVEEIAENYKKGRPVLVGTTSIEKNEYLSRLLRNKNIPHELLNAKNHEREAKIIAMAGEKGAVTVATNMAGRGVDIILGGAQPSLFEQKDASPDDPAYKKEMEQWQKNHDEVVSLGGLYVIGTERHESRRIDNQLRGRSGRQGDPGETRFFVSLEDDLMRIFGGEQISKMMTFLNFPEDQPLSHPMVSRAIEQAQVKVEGFNFDIRKHLVDFDDVLNKQREIVYSLRRKIVEVHSANPQEFRETVLGVFNEEINGIMQSYLSLDTSYTDEELEPLRKEIELMYPENAAGIADYMKKRDFQALQAHLMTITENTFMEREKQVGQEIWFDLVRTVFISTIDQYWTEHLTAIEDLREGINLRGYAQLDPLVEYKNDAYSMFEKLIASINFDVTRRLFRIEIKMSDETIDEIKKELPKPEPKKMEFRAAASVDPFTVQQQQQTVVPPVEPAVVERERPTGGDPGDAKITVRHVGGGEETAQPAQPQDIGGFRIIPPGSTSQKLGRNDPCWCGSGKKYKKCHWPN